MPLQAPVDYSVATPAPEAALQSGLQLGAGMAERDFTMQQRDLALQQQQIAMRRQAEQRQDLVQLSMKPNPTARDYGAIVLKYPELKDSFKTTWEGISTEQRQQRLDNAAPVFAAMQSGRPDIAVSLLQKNVDALKNSGGSPEDIRAAETWLKMAQEAPAHAQQLGGIFLASVMGPEKFEATFGKVGNEARENAAAPGQRDATAATTAKTLAGTATDAMRAEAEVKDINSKIADRAGRLALDTDKLATETGVAMARIQAQYGQLQPDARKLVNESAAAAVIAGNTAVQMRGLADQFEKADPHSFGGAPIEALKTFTGSQDYVTQLRREYTRIRAGQVNALLPPGPASDKDIKNAQAGFLTETANPVEIASWLRGVAKLQDYQAKYEEARGEWAAAVGHLGKATKDIDIGGVKVAAGTTLVDFLRQTLAAPGPATQAPKPAAKTGYMQKYGGGAQ